MPFHERVLDTGVSFFLAGARVWWARAPAAVHPGGGAWCLGQSLPSTPHSAQTTVWKVLVQLFQGFRDLWF